MAGKSAGYWKSRFESLEKSQYNRGMECYEELERQYRKAEKEIEGQISSWYQRFADNNEISLTEARRMLNSKELAEFKWDVNDYIKYGEENAMNGQWMKQLENASARYHVSRLESLEMQMQQQIETLFGNQLDTLDSAMKNIYTEGYYHTAYEIQKGVGVGWDFATLDTRTIDKVINKPWAADGKNFSERVWDNREKLVNELNQTLVQNIILGQDPQKAINAIADKLNVSKRSAGRLVMTEEAYFSSEAQKDCFNELDVEQYEIVATLDSHTSEICQEMDGKVFPMSQWEVGATAPPFHPWCRSTTVPAFGDEFDNMGTRAARDEETGKTYQVPGNCTYDKWEKAFVEGDKSVLQEITDNAKIINNALQTISFNNANEANAYFGEKPDRSLRRSDREKYDQLREEYEQSMYGSWENELTGEQTAAIGHYSGDDYSAINGVLRGEMTENQVKLWDSNGNATTLENINNLTDAISQFQLKDNITVYRTCEEDVFKNLQKQIGSIFVDNGFTSTSVLSTPVASGNVKMVIDVPAGTGVGAWISPLSGSPDEYEFLIQRGTSYRIDSIQESNNEIQIHMTVVGNDPKEDITYATKEQVIQRWKEKGIYDEDNAKLL